MCIIAKNISTFLSSSTLSLSLSLALNFPCYFFIYFDCCIFKHEFSNNNLCVYWGKFFTLFLWLRGKRDNWKYFVSNWILIAFVFCCCRIDFFKARMKINCVLMSSSNIFLIYRIDINSFNLLVDYPRNFHPPQITKKN